MVFFLTKTKDASDPNLSIKAECIRMNTDYGVHKSLCPQQALKPNDLGVIITDIEVESFTRGNQGDIVRTNYAQHTLLDVMADKAQG